LFSLSFRAKKLPLRGTFRDGNSCSRDARRHDRERQLGVTQHTKRDAGQLTECLSRECERGRKEPRSTERARPTEGRADPGGDSKGDEAQNDDRWRHAELRARRRREDREPSELSRSLERELTDHETDDACDRLEGRVRGHGYRRDAGEARTGLDRLPCYDAAPDDLVPVIEDGGLTRRHEGRGIEVERRVVSVHVDVCGECDAAVTQDCVRREAG